MAGASLIVTLDGEPDGGVELLDRTEGPVRQGFR
jgi:hypothetical protein